MNDKKVKIFGMLKDDHSTEQQVKTAIEEYETRYPDDMDLYVMKADYAVQTGDLEGAKRLLEEGCLQYPYSGQLYFMMAEVREKLGDEIDAVKYYMQAIAMLGEEDHRTGIAVLRTKELTDKCRKHFELQTERKMYDESELRKLLRQAEGFFGMSESSFGRNEIRFRSKNRASVGRYYYFEERKEKYVGAYRSGFQMLNDHRDLENVCGEFRDVMESREYMCSNDVCILPIAAGDEPVTMYISEPDGAEHMLVIDELYTFYYFRLKKNTCIRSDQPMLIGKEILCQHSPGRKRLVLSLFVDGCAQQLLSQDEIEKWMPNTYEFFSNGGKICTNAHCTGEWTLPSIAGIMSGLPTTDHKVFHSDLDYRMPSDIVTLAERFQASGYYTSAINGNWRIIPVYGMDRGFDNFLYQHQWVRWKADRLIGEAIEYIDAFKETDQYVWLSIGDLHEVADEYALPLSVQTQLPIAARQNDDSNHGTSVKQGFSGNKIIQYQKMLKYVDRQLGILFGYLRKNYRDDEMVISLFSDHGQGFLIKDEAEFLSKERTNVPMMFRDGNQTDLYTDELLSTLDYGEALCKLCGNYVPNPGSAGRVPVFLGASSERAFTLTESIHPGDPYQAVIHDKEYTYYFYNAPLVQQDGRFELGDYRAYLKDANGNDVRNDAICKQYTEYILKRIAPYCIY